MHTPRYTSSNARTDLEVPILSIFFFEFPNHFLTINLTSVSFSAKWLRNYLSGDDKGKKLTVLRPDCMSRCIVFLPSLSVSCQVTADRPSFQRPSSPARNSGGRGGACRLTRPYKRASHNKFSPICSLRILLSQSSLIFQDGLSL